MIAIKLVALLLLLTSQSILADDQETNDNKDVELFPDIFSFLLGRDRFRFQYEMSSIEMKEGKQVSV